MDRRDLDLVGRMRRIADVVASLAYLLFSGMLLTITVGIILPVAKYGFKFLMFMLT